MKKILPRLIVPLACLLLSGPALGAQSQPEAAPASASSVEVSDGRLSVRLENAPLGEVARQLTEKAGVAFYFEDESLRQGRVDAVFRNKPLGEGVQEIAENFNTILIYDRDRRLLAVHILPKAPPSQGGAAPAAAPREGGMASPPVPGLDQPARLPGMPPGTQVEIRPETPEGATPDAGQPASPPGEEPAQPSTETPVPETPPDQTLPPPGREPGSPPPPALRNLREPGKGQ